VVKAKDIFEIDLKAAFDSVSLSHMAKTLHMHGIPKHLVEQLVLLSVSPTIMPEVPLRSDVDTAS
jgi:hypothetical protein